MKKETTEQEAYLQLAALCAQAEHCQQEMRDKMRRWELDETAQIQQGLWMKHIDDDIQQRVLSEVDDTEYLAVLKPLLKQKAKSIKAENDYELTQKLVRFALGRGCTYDIIRQCLDVDEEMIPDDETD